MDWEVFNAQIEKEAAGKGTPGEDYGRGLDRVTSIIQRSLHRKIKYPCRTFSKWEDDKKGKATVRKDEETKEVRKPSWNEERGLCL